MNIRLKRAEIVNDLYDLKKECEILLNRCDKLIDDILKVQTEEEANEFYKTHDIEEGLNLIRIF